MLVKTRSRSILATLLLLTLPAVSMAQVSLNISVGVPPPELPVYDQPPIPDEGYIWTPGYWAWGDDIQDYYWVPGTWVLAPQPGYLWTPGYWGWQGGAYLWNRGYWGPHVGFYGGVNYGYGYGGNGYEGGYWEGGHLYYNRSVNNINNTRITNVYNKTVINNVTVNRVSFNGGTGGVRAQPSSGELAAAHERHIEPIPAQHHQEQAARSNPVLRASRNQGHPPIAATARPGAFAGAGVVPARGGTLSVVHSQPPPRAAQPEARPYQPAPHVEPTEAPLQTHHPAVEPRAIVQPRPAFQPHPPLEERRAPEQAQPPRPAAPLPHPAAPAVPRAQSREAPRPAGREEDHERH